MKDRQTIKKVLFTLIVLSACNCTLLHADNYAIKINTLNNNILEINKKLNSVEETIQKTDLDISKQAKHLNSISNKIKKTNIRKSKLSKEKQSSIKQLAEQQRIMLKQLETMYVLYRSNNANNLSSLTKVNNIEQLNRVLNYLKKYNQYNVDTINDIKVTIKKIESLDENLNFIAKQQKTLQSKITASYNELNLLKANNIRAKKELKSNLNSTMAKLDYYKTQQSRLNNILSDSLLGQNTNNISGLFIKAKGKLPLPVTGKIDKSNKTNKSQNSVFINTAEGQSVAAIFSGKVVFSNWLRGFGFLTIVDHGNGYMSLYGNNQTLFKKADDFVEAGEIIALTGSSGGITSPGLYFEIRHNGSSVDTASWLNPQASWKTYS